MLQEYEDHKVGRYLLERQWEVRTTGDQHQTKNRERPDFILSAMESWCYVLLESYEEQYLNKTGGAKQLEHTAKFMAKLSLKPWINNFWQEKEEEGERLQRQRKIAKREKTVEMEETCIKTCHFRGVLGEAIRDWELLKPKTRERTGNIWDQENGQVPETLVLRSWLPRSRKNFALGALRFCILLDYACGQGLTILCNLLSLSASRYSINTCGLRTIK